MKTTSPSPTTIEGTPCANLDPTPIPGGAVGDFEASQSRDVELPGQGRVCRDLVFVDGNFLAKETLEAPNKGTCMR